MSYVRIGSEQRPFSEVSEQWISEQLRRRNADGTSTCVQVVLKTSYVDIILSTADCPKGAGGGRPPTQQERALFDLWNRRGLNEAKFNPGSLIAFLKQAA